ncbi:unnamed protein product [Sphenostylis stenocarpa]|uniref:Uncharacterized protein n=1 Tax=Sphenostylis stenocarpa TaxID=92480 RepID=A0AA86SJ73_9FABA|nr:unnamed protein product [Sphenostylis stenocarpa]
MQEIDKEAKERSREMGKDSSRSVQKRAVRMNAVTCKSDWAQINEQKSRMQAKEDNAKTIKLNDRIELGFTSVNHAQN